MPQEMGEMEAREMNGFSTKMRRTNDIQVVDNKFSGKTKSLFYQFSVNEDEYVVAFSLPKTIMLHVE